MRYSGGMTNIADSEIRTKGSLCSGTGALDMATPGELQWVAETNEAAASVLKREHPFVPNLGDITQQWLAGLEPVDLITSGDPCQSMSAAGRQMASADDRFLWPDVMRVIRAVRPRHVFLENVQNLTSVALVKGADDWRGQRGSVLKLRLDDLRESGYAVRWTVLGACAVGAPHHRHRWFLRAAYVGLGAPEAVKIENRCGAPRGGGRPLLATPMSSDAKGPGKSRTVPWDNPPSHIFHMLPTPAARDGGERGTPTPEHALRRVANPERSVNLEDAALAYLLPTPRATDIGTPGRRSSEGWRPQLGQAVLETWGKFAEAVTLWETLIGRPAPDPTEPAPRGGRRLNAALSEWMMGYPAGYLTEGHARNEALKMAGNGVVALQARAAWGLLA